MTDPNNTLESLATSIRHRAGDLNGDGYVSFGEMIEMLGPGSIGAVLTIIAIPALLPSTGIPIGTVMSLGMFAIALAMLMGADNVRLPKRLSQMQISGASAKKVMNTIARVFEFMERWAHPRLKFLTSGLAKKILSLKVFIMAFLIFLPIPFGNTIPAFSLLILGPAIMFRDGVAVIASTFVAIVAVAVTAGLFWTGAWAFEHAL
jgi:hypothetical protein